MKTLLIVDDDIEILDLLSRMASLLGYSALSVSSPSKAVKVAQDLSNPIASILTDVDMPGMNGFELARRINAHRPELKVIFMSGKCRPDNTGIAFLQKPFTLEQLAQALHP